MPLIFLSGQTCKTVASRCNVSGSQWGERLWDFPSASAPWHLSRHLPCLEIRVATILGLGVAVPTQNPLFAGVIVGVGVSCLRIQCNLLCTNFGTDSCAGVTGVTLVAGVIMESESQICGISVTLPPMAFIAWVAAGAV